LLTPAGTPKEIVVRLNTEVARILRSAETAERLYSFGAEAIVNTPEEFAAYINSEFVKWAKVVKSAGLRAE
jgi:tripartite-type tricarboxylate transporter receptor subunit TctC